MNWFDLALAVTVLASIIIGFGRGFARTAVNFIAFFAAIICGLWFYSPLGLWLRPFTKSQPAADGAGFILVFIAVSMLGCIVERLLVKVVEETGFAWPDRMLGAAFGVVQGLLLVTAFVLVFMALAPRPLPRAVVDSRYVPYLENAAHVLATAAPPQVQQGYYSAQRDLQKVLPEPMKRQVGKLSSM